MAWIGITIGKAFWDERWRYYCPEDYVRAVLAAGGRPILLPAEALLAAGEEPVARCDGFLLSGGGDLDPRLFGQEPHPKNSRPDPARDRAEIALVRRAIEAGRPLLCICRGLQILNVTLGGDLIQDLPSSGYPGHEQAEPRWVTTHLVLPERGTLLAEIMPEPAMVNSFHHQAVGRLAPPLVAAARSPDGIVEAAELPGRPVLGVQWHPENYAHLAPEAARLFAWLVEAARDCARSW
ncbi:MAG: gamma-glutamyl-gamma-aminobutyrate hydrolase family protein [Firmicutes bacterium]|nr:gamma-glutamyl-gamma-aminobutyrate hydrolase family protein [Bacillota bacterium]